MTTTGVIADGEVPATPLRKLPLTVSRSSIGSQLELFDSILHRFALRCRGVSSNGTDKGEPRSQGGAAEAALASAVSASSGGATIAAKANRKATALAAATASVAPEVQPQPTPPKTVEDLTSAIALFVFPQSLLRYLVSVRLVAVAGDAAASAAASATGTTATTAEAPTPVKKPAAASTTMRLPPFSSDSDFLVGKEFQYVLATWVRSGSNLHLHHGMSQLLKDTGLSLVDSAACLSECLALFHEHVAFRLQSMVTPPRLLRVANALHMSAKEIEALSYLQVCHCGSHFVFAVANSLSPSSIAKYAEMSPHELLDFMAEYRDHMKQGLVQFDSMCRMSLMESKLTLPQEVVAAFTGVNISEEQLIKLEKTALASIVWAERSHVSQPFGGGSPTVATTTAAGADGTTAGKGNSDGLLRHNQSRAGKRKAHTRSPSTSHSESGSDESKCNNSDSDENEGEWVVVDHEEGDSDSSSNGSDEAETEESGKADKRKSKGKLHAALHSYLGGDDIDPSLVEKLQQAVQCKQRAKASAGVDRQKKRRRRETGGDAVDDVIVEGKTVAAEATTNVEGANEQSPVVLPTTTTTTPTRPVAVFCGERTSKMHEPYTSDIDYIDDAFKILSNLIKIRNAEGDMKDDVEDNFYNIPKTKVESTIRELKGKFRVQSHTHRSRIQATRERGNGWLPRIEQVADKLGLSETEKLILLLLVGNVVSHDVLIAINGRYVMRDGQRELSVGYMLFVLCDGLKERVASRRYFYQSAPLVAHGLLSVNLTSSARSCFNTDLTDYGVDIDRKIVDYLMGTEMETGEMVPGSKLYTPNIPLENVVLPKETTELVLNTIEHFSLFDRCKRQCGFGDGLGSSGAGLVFLFYGPSGTGKTMLANAVAHNLGKKLLLVNLLQFKADTKYADGLRFIFREAKLNDAVVFFDECETFFETRESNPLVTAILAEFERYDGIIILATNRAQIIDEAMNRRISLMIEFKLPDHQMREKIWAAHFPKHLKLASDVDVEGLALDFELTGGLIRNAVLAAISAAVAREKSETPTIHFEDCKYGARQQLRGFFLASERPSGGSEMYLTPKRSLDELIVEPSTRTALETIAKLTKSRNTLFSQWGFKEHDCHDQGAAYLLYGPSGTGKSLSVEGIAYECGCTVRLCNVQELLLSAKDMSIQGIFDEARKLGAIVVFDNAQALFDHSERSMQISQLIQYHAVTYPRPTIVIATTGGSTAASSAATTIDSRAARLQFVEEIAFAVPSKALRRELWRRALPAKVPTASDVDFAILAEQQVTAKLIRSVCFSACCKVALLPPDRRTLTMKMLLDEREEAMMRERRRATHSSMFA